MTKLFKGVGTALITPFDAEGDVDYETLEFLVNFQIANNVNFLVPCGTTGESPTLSSQEHVDVVRAVVEYADGRVPVLAGTGSNSTREAVYFTEEADEAGADGALVVSPYYNKPTPKGFWGYYEQVAEVGLPVVLYDIPGRTAQGVPTDVILDLAHEGIIAGVKWASGDRSQLMDMVKGTPDDFSVVSGNDDSTLELMVLGGDGVISVASNIVPIFVNALVQGCSRGDFVKSRRIHYDLLPLFRALFLETNPIPVKTAFHLLHGRGGGVVDETPRFRSPMCKMDKENLKALQSVLKLYFN